MAKGESVTANFVPAEGPVDADIIMIGEAPGRQEDIRRRPFVGPSGDLQEDIWREVGGIKRYQVYIDNLYPWMPPGGKIENVSDEALAKAVINLRERVGLLPKPHVIVPTGNYATFALTGKGKVKAGLRKALGEDLKASEAEKKAGITKLRGSVYEYTTLGGKKCKVIPTIHPAYFLRGQRHKLRRAYADWRRIKRESVSPELVGRERRHLVSPTQFEVEKFVEYVKYNESNLLLSVDIETWGRTLSCVGFAVSPDYSITLPTTSKEQRETFLPMVQLLADTRCPKILQNGLYDTYWLDGYGIRLRNWQWDTLAMAHALNPGDEYALDYLCSIYVPDYRYWKDEAKDAEEIRKYARDLDSLWFYNGLDCCYTYELCQYLHQELMAADRMEFYCRHYQELFGPLLEMMLHGIRVDCKRQKAWAKELMTDCAGIRERLKGVAGTDLFATKDFSNAKLQKFFYTTLGVPKITKISKRKEGKVRAVSTDKTALTKMIFAATNQKNGKKYEKAVEPARLILDHRRKKKLGDFLKGAWDKDGRIRCSYKFTTISGRLASSGNPRGRGYNLQNPDREVRDTFLPDEGKVFVKIDMSQIEDRLCKVYTGAKRMVEMANLRPDEFDAHTYNASRIFGCEMGEVDKKRRSLGKMAVHGAQRGMSGKKLADKLLTDNGLVIPFQDCQKMIDAYLEDHWEVRDIYFPMVRSEIWDNQRLVNSWGRVLPLDRRFVEYSDDFWREMYSWYMQSECADWMNQWGIKAAYGYIKAFPDCGCRINLQVHDEIVVSCPPDGRAYDIARFLVASLEQPRLIRGNWLVVPADVCVAGSWKDKRHEFKRMPPKEEFMDVVETVWKEVEGEKGNC